MPLSFNLNTCSYRVINVAYHGFSMDILKPDKKWGGICAFSENMVFIEFTQQFILQIFS